MRNTENRVEKMLRIAGMTVVCALLFASTVSAQSTRPVKLECESLSTPLGMDSKEPLLSWQMEDSRAGARQTAYQIVVGPTEAGVAAGKGDLWDSGRVESQIPQGVPYKGAALEPSKRYYWRVVIWDENGKASTPSAPTWWETGLLVQANWKAQWIGYEESELRQVREAGAVWITNADGEAPKGAEKTSHDFRLHFELGKAVRRGVLYVTGQDSAGAWLNGKQVIQAQPLPPWRQMPWKTYTIRDVSNALRTGQNLLAVEVLRYAP